MSETPGYDARLEDQALGWRGHRCIPLFPLGRLFEPVLRCAEEFEISREVYAPSRASAKTLEWTGTAKKEAPCGWGFETGKLGGWG